MSRRPGRDPGLQPERTLLSWQRTLIVVIATVLLYVRDPFHDVTAATGRAVEALHRLPIGLVVLAVAGVLMVHVRRRWRATDHGCHDDATGTPPAPVARPWALFLLSGSVAALGVVVAVTAVLG
ncbi:DUF202 domain-containing protein [Marinactinospora thermotolerans]|uniref:DUF202 domain-containing protein n=1 Tax=Marinactinospora thermotolerans DSM 45154 TaxID=1122192 RepID=A0A1T4T1I1_9ACTN|nr:DUF202 domain-containing protein [Marinactinospora thermotolerans]SKA34305.1 protein of unknown function [Marinactinospora thermotolerans DSM 45154]